MKNLNVTIKSVLDMFGESERCVMHKNTTPIDVVEKFLTNDELDKLIGQYPTCQTTKAPERETRSL